MPRDRAKINTGIWGDSDWKRLPAPQQWLYFTLLTRPELNHVGVGDWRPRRIANLTTEMTAEAVERAAAGLQSEHFILIDPDTEEVLVRSFLKHDGVLQNPNLGALIKGAYDSVYSAVLQSVVIYELRKLARRDPNLPVLTSAKSKRYVAPLLELEATPISDHLNGVPNGVGNGVPKGRGTASRTAFQKGDPSTTATTTPSLSSESEGGSGGRQPARPLPAEWSPNEAHAQRAEEKNLDLDAEAENFRLHAQSNDRRQANWNAAFTMWLNKSHPKGKRPQYQSAAERNHQISAERHQRIVAGEFGRRPDPDDPTLWGLPPMIEEA